MPLHLRSLSNSKAVTRNKKSCLGKKYLNPLHPSKTTTPNRFSSKQPFHPRGNVRPSPPQLHNVCSHPDAAAELGLPGFTSTILERPCVKKPSVQAERGQPARTPARQPGRQRAWQHGDPSVRGGGGAATETIFRVRSALSPSALC